MPRVNMHATAIVVGRSGLLIIGPSGSGKTGLALSLVDLCRARSVFARLVVDDQVWLRVVHGRLVAEAPDSIAGLAEIYGFGPARVDHEPRAVIDGVVELVDHAAAPRYREGAIRELPGVTLPRLDLEGGDVGRAARAVLAWLDDGGPN